MKFFTSITLATIFVIACSLAKETAGECCLRAGIGELCPDGTAGTPCCSHGKCNIFCCNCDGGCRMKNLPLSDDIETRLNTCASMKMSLEEFSSFAHKKGITGSQTITSMFNLYDVNSDGSIDRNEMASAPVLI